MANDQPIRAFDSGPAGIRDYGEGSVRVVEAHQSVLRIVAVIVCKVESEPFPRGETRGEPIVAIVPTVIGQSILV